MLSSCLKCSGREFMIDEYPVENSTSVYLVERCENCGFIVNFCVSDSPCDLSTALEKLGGI